MVKPDAIQQQHVWSGADANRRWADAFFLHPDCDYNFLHPDCDNYKSKAAAKIQRKQILIQKGSHTHNFVETYCNALRVEDFFDVDKTNQSNKCNKNSQPTKQTTNATNFNGG